MKQEKTRIPKIKNAYIKQFRFQSRDHHCEVPIPQVEFCWKSKRMRNVRSIAFVIFLSLYCLSLMVLLMTREKIHGIRGLTTFVRQSKWRLNHLLKKRAQVKLPTNSTAGRAIERIADEQDSARGRLIASLSEPHVHKKFTSSAFGAWMKDPNSTDDRIFVMDNYYRNNKVVVYDSMEHFMAGFEPETHTLPVDWGGTGHAVLNGHLYFNMYNTSTICRYNFERRSLVRSSNLPNSGFGNLSPYQWAGSTDIDFSVDQGGVKVIYATPNNNWNIAVSQLEEESLKVKHTWYTDFRKRSAGNAFIANGVLYTLQRYDIHVTTLNYAFELRTSRCFWPKIPIEIRYGAMSSLDYNDNEKRLYGWDRGHLVSYQVKFIT